MPKKPLKLKFRLPPYEFPRNAWRKRIHTIAQRAAKTLAVVYDDKDRLEVNVRLYLQAPAIISHDVDNRLKDILDALQGRAGGSKAKQTFSAIIPNDRQIYRVVIEKQLPPWQSHGLGHVVVKRLQRRK